ncbi:MAG: hypothetical protein LBQ54_15315 [Planctomycetaceae bacterium]|jgi:hypothetical protein|nr:hypothetical protein [Planctomycetaceae bacterium]
MTEKNRLFTKIIYVVIIIAVLLPLIYLGSPSVPEKNDQGETTYSGGLLATKLRQAGLSDTEIGKIDPTGSTIQLATFGMKGIAIALLWHQQLDYEKKKDWQNVIHSGNQIMVLEPHFVPVWEFLGWKLAYNASADVDDYRERYAWVIRGFDFLTRGTEYNQNSPILFSSAGWTISQKIGIADEVVEYRKLFREDDDFHNTYHTRSLEERDNWLFGIPLYQKAEKLFEAGYSINNKTRLVFYSNSRMNLIHYAEWFEKDGKFGEKAKEVWRNAETHWRDFANLEVETVVPDRKDPAKKRRTSLGLAVKAAARKAEILKEIESMMEEPLRDLYLKRWKELNDLEKASMVEMLTSPYNKEPEIAVVKTRLNETVPDWEEKFRKERDSLVTEEEQKKVRAIPPVLRTEEENDLAQKSEREISQAAAAAAQKLKIPLQEQVLSVSKENFGKAEDLRQEYETLDSEERFSNMFREITNYEHHGNQCRMEQTQEAVQAREDRYNGRKRYFEPNGLFDADTGYFNAMKKWRELIENHKSEYDYVADPQFRSQFLELVEKYKVIRDKPEFGGFYPEDLPLAFVVVYECEEQDRVRELAEAYQFAQTAFGNGDFAAAERFGKTMSSIWHANMENREYLKAVPVPDYRDAVIDVAALYIRAIQKTGTPFDSQYPLTGYLNHVISRDPLAEAAVRKTGDVMMENSAPKEGYLQRVEEAALAWKPVLDKYPILTVPEDLLVDQANGLNSSNLVIYRNEMRRLARLYKQLLSRTQKEVPEDFVLSGFL